MSPETDERADYLTRIMARKEREVARLRPRAGELRARAADRPRSRGWEAALRLSDRVALIAEIKRRAPSAGDLRPDLDPASLAGTYGEAGAAAVSVLTDSDFGGHLDDLRRARASVELPVLRKDFILDPVQIWESRAADADAVLLIVRALGRSRLSELLAVAEEAGLGTLVEVHDEAELEGALEAGAKVIGVNNRDLRTFETSLDVTRRLAPRVSADRVLVAESGIESSEEVEEMGRLGVDAVLVGRALVSDEDPGALARAMVGRRKRERVCR